MPNKQATLQLLELLCGVVQCNEHMANAVTECTAKRPGVAVVPQG